MVRDILGMLIFVFFLAGCGEDKNKDINIISASKSQGAQPSSDTAIYFKDGVGVDFGVSPQSDKIIESSGDVRVLTYYLEYPPLDVDSAVSDILGSEGYLRVEKPAGNNDLSVIYTKSSGAILFRYKQEVAEGLVKKTKLIISWWI